MSNRWYHVKCNSPLPLANDEMLSTAHIPFGPWGIWFDHWSSHFLAKSTDQHQMAIWMMSSICHMWSPNKFLSIKPLFYRLPAVFRLMLTLLELSQKTKTLLWTTALPTSLWEYTNSKYFVFSSYFTFHYQTHCLTSIKFNVTTGCTNTWLRPSKMNLKDHQMRILTGACPLSEKQISIIA